MKNIQITSGRAAQTMALAKALAQCLLPGDIIFLVGELGAGKTTFTKGLATGLKIKESTVNSPTFIMMNYYKGKIPIYHFDFYRIQKPEELLTIDLEEYFYGQGVTVIEWPQRLGDAAPHEYLQVTLEHVSEDERRISVCASGRGYAERLGMIKEQILKVKRET